MTYKPGHLRNRSGEIVNARNWGIGIATGLLGLGLFVSEIQRIGNLHFGPEEYAYSALLFLSGLLVYLWIWATQKEMDLLIDWLDPERWVPPSSVKETFLILLIAAMLAALLVAARDPFVYGAIFTAYSAVLIPSTRYMNAEIREAIDKSKQRLAKDAIDAGSDARTALYLNAVTTLDTYFLRRLVFVRLAAILIASLFATALAGWANIVGSQATSILAYVILCATIILSEVVIARWRIIRDDSLRTIERELAEFQR